MKIYKIRNKETGLFSSGGSYAEWQTAGKTWKSLPNLKSHLSMYNYRYALESVQTFYNGSEVVEFELVEVDAKNIVRNKIENV